MDPATTTANEIIKYVSRKSGKRYNDIKKVYRTSRSLLEFFKATIPLPIANNMGNNDDGGLSYKTKNIIAHRNELLGDLTGGTYVDHGCGVGTITTEIADVVSADKVIGIDVYVHPSAKIPILKPADDGTLPLADDSVNLVTCFLSLHHVPKELQEKTMAEIARILVKGGRLLIYEHNFINVKDFNLRFYLDAVHMTFMFYGSKNEADLLGDPSKLTHRDVQWIFDSTYHPAEYYRDTFEKYGLKKVGGVYPKNKQEMYYESFIKE